MARFRSITDDEIRRLIEDNDSDDNNDSNVVNLIDDNLVEEESDFEEVDNNNNVEENEEDIDYRVMPTTYKNKIQTKYQLINSIEKSLDPNKYNIIDTNSEEEIIAVKIKHPNNNKHSINWTNVPPVSGKISAENIITPQPEVKIPYQNCHTQSQCFGAFIDDEMINSIVYNTNAKLQCKIEMLTAKKVIILPQHSLHYTNVVEIKAFIGLMFYRGLLKQNHFNYSILFSDKMGTPIFSATMSRNRFTVLHSNISFDDINTRKDRWEFDKFTAIRELFEDFNNNCSSVIAPQDYLSLDETLYPCRTQISFKQYNPNKPAKYGLLYKSINAARYPYTYRTSVYSGKPSKDPGPYYVKGVAESVKHLVENLETHSSLKGTNISMDRLYTSIELSEWLLSKKITVVGTIKSNRKGLPPTITSCTDRAHTSYKYVYNCAEKKMSLHSYVVKTKSKGKKNVLVLSTIPPIMGITKDDKKKPAIIKFYDFTKGGTDVMDQRIGYGTTNSKSDRWTATAFKYILDTARVNAQTVWSLTNKFDPLKTNSFDFGIALAESLIMPHIAQRNTTHFSAALKMKIKCVLGTTATADNNAATADNNAATEENVTATFSKRSESRKRCYMCISDIKETAETKSAKRIKVNRLNLNFSQCQFCGQAICGNHQATTKCKGCCAPP
jgi:hypothetical protein